MTYLFPETLSQNTFNRTIASIKLVIKLVHPEKYLELYNCIAYHRDTNGTIILDVGHPQWNNHR